MKESVSKCQWNIEREVRKLIQNSMRKLISGKDHEETSSIMENIKSLEQGVIGLVNSKI